MLTTMQAYELGFEHGSEMARESGSNDAGCEGWDGLLINANPTFAAEQLGWGGDDDEPMASYVRGAQAGADTTTTGETMTTTTTQHEQLAEQLAGQHYNAIRDAIHSLDWDGCYPEVDHDGNLTGNFISAESTEHDICDVTDHSIKVGDYCCDAMIAR